MVVPQDYNLYVAGKPIVGMIDGGTVDIIEEAMWKMFRPVMLKDYHN